MKRNEKNALDLFDIWK